MINSFIPSILAGLLLAILEPKRKYLGFLMPLMFFSMGLSLAISSHFSYLTYDLQLQSIDGIFGFQPQELLRDWVFKHPLICILSIIAYVGVPVWFTLIIYDRQDSMQLIKKLALSSILGLMIYQLCPACGPAYIHLGKMHGQFLSMPLNIPRNAMPSLHLTWALLIFLNCKPWSSQWRILSGALVIFTTIATLASGEHYLIDLIAAIPFTFLINWIGGFEYAINIRLRTNP